MASDDAESTMAVEQLPEYTDAATTFEDGEPTDLHIPKGRTRALCGAKAPDSVLVKTTTSGWCDDCLKVAVTEASDAE